MRINPLPIVFYVPLFIRLNTVIRKRSDNRGKNPARGVIPLFSIRLDITSQLVKLLLNFQDLRKLCIHTRLLRPIIAIPFPSFTHRLPRDLPAAGASSNEVIVHANEVASHVGHAEIKGRE